MDRTTKREIEALIKIFNQRIANIACRSLKRFEDLCRELPGFQNDPLQWREL